MVVFVHSCELASIIQQIFLEHPSSFMPVTEDNWLDMSLMEFPD